MPLSSGRVFDTVARAVCTVSVRGADNLPSREPSAGPALIVINHTTAVDVLVTMAGLYRAGLWVDLPCSGGCAPGHRHFKVMVTEDLLRYPVTRQMANRSGVIPVGRDHGTSALLAARRALDAGDIVVVYPEGDLSVVEDGSPRAWRPGTSLLATRHGVPVHPLAHHDARSLGRGPIPVSIAHGLTGVVRRPTIRLFAGAPVHPAEWAGLTSSDTVALLQDRLRQTWTVAKTGALPAE